MLELLAEELENELATQSRNMPGVYGSTVIKLQRLSKEVESRWGVFDSCIDTVTDDSKFGSVVAMYFGHVLRHSEPVTLG